jgi:hypothetical protein
MQISTFSSLLACIISFFEPIPFLFFLTASVAFSSANCAFALYYYKAILDRCAENKLDSSELEQKKKIREIEDKQLVETTRAEVLAEIASKDRLDRTQSDPASDR